MTSIARTPEYLREYQRRRGRGLPTRGLAAEMAAGRLQPTIDPDKLREAQRLYARGRRTSEVMATVGLNYGQAQDIRAGMA